jgi:hypothetical protein
MEMLFMRKMIGFLFAVCLAPGVFAQTTGVPVQSVTVTLTAAQVQSLLTTPVTLVAAQGPGTYINAISAVLQYKFGTTPYTASGGGFAITIGPPANGDPVLTSSGAHGFITQTTNAMAIAAAVGQGDVQTNLANQPLMVGNNGNAPWTGGDGTVTITVFYIVLTLQ